MTQTQKSDMQTNTKLTGRARRNARRNIDVKEATERLVACVTELNKQEPPKAV